MKPTIEELRRAFRYTLKCARCGEDFVLTSPQAMRRKYCDDCRGIVYREMHRKASAAFKERKRSDGLHGNQKRCARCGAVFEKQGYRKYCDDCRGIVKQEQTNDSRERNRRKRGTLIGETIEATCKMCGKPFSYVYGGGMKRAYCDRCSIGRSQVVYYGSDEPPRKKKKPRVSQIEAINEAARASGMSYGQYQAMRYMKGV